ncbi:hypothetical protein [Leptospira idonii]|uniref:Yip1 domain-containing protein n=1 Tax=Leptospira idonii TaxID=1193500 RepID=A0A4R9LUB4_9LEPT|nr:hypothetical protein [Leptospira idonii]TGN17332.1 hypothetical protein EHS15_17515 [Leptospira idonii]
MRDLFYDFVDLLEILFLEPLRYAEEVNEIPFAVSKSSNWLFSILAALSISTGMSLLSPPYTISTISFLIFGFISNLIILRFFPFFFGIVLDYYVHSKARNIRIGTLISFARHAVVVFVLFGSVAMILQSLGIYGVGTGLFLLSFLFIVYAVLVGRGAKYIYDLKDKDAIRFSYTALGITLLFPFLLNLYTATTILQSFAGGF